ncbi:multicopper oxidase domain-containing protein [Nocardia sp. CDC153]|uniref:multicopper oxidase family protein n=1 Tax=Nocardia sp. CDC153 TaxID=3112167 RepID=UPI002DB8FBD0|nr:multicopper oxidase domain-containing protein [Nocardia sp. CDC153]MEC3956306.1 multicopper oxidase domain-containing protein [Nocardia sp. CDC153]
MISRRRLLVSTAALSVTAALGCTRTAPAPPRRRLLPIPPLADSHVDAAGVRHFSLTARSGHSEILPGISTATWGYNGDMLGPTLRARRGETVSVTVTNTLPEATSVHWHGMHVPAAADGGPHQMLAPAATWTARWRIDQPAATLWYHPHPHGTTEKHVYRGLAGLFYLDDDPGDRLDLPRRYGIDDIPLVIQDRRFTPDGQLDEKPTSTYGLLGDTLIVNGATAAHHRLPATRARLRLLNGCASRLLNLGFGDNRPFGLIATDGGLLTSPVPLPRLTLSPGERAEIIVDLSPGETATLRSFPITTRTGIDRPQRFGFDDDFDVLTMHADTTAAPADPLPATLATIPAVGAELPVTRGFDLKWFMINGAKMDMNRIDLTIPTGATEVWSVRNLEDWPHNFHVHDVQFQIRSIDNAPPPPALAGWKDTVYTEPGRVYELAMHFAGPADPTLPYMYHCHLLHHEDAGMMGQFLILDPGQAPAFTPAPMAEHSMPMPDNPTGDPNSMDPMDPGAHHGH